MTENIPGKTAGGNILVSAAVKYVLAIILIGALLFIPAGSFGFTNGWIYLAGIMIPMSAVLVYLAVKDPELLAKRLNAREKEKEQKRYVAISTLLFLAGFIIPGLDFRFGWSHVPMWIVIAALAVMLGGYGMFMAVIMQNRYASRTIEIQQGQKLIDTGLYSIIRHPMYLAATILYLASPVVLGSFWALLPMLLLPAILGYRIVNEEKVLKEGLPGYKDYCEKVRFRMIPFIW